MKTVKKLLLVFLCLAMCHSILGKGAKTPDSTERSLPLKGGPHSCIPRVTYDKETVTVASDSTLNDVRIVVKNTRWNVMCDETVDLRPQGQTLYVPDREGEEKLTIDLYHEGEQFTGVFDD